jgi:hypothetical protein
MANKAVLGVAALGVAAYSLSEYEKERSVKREEEEARQAKEDRIEELMQRQMEAEMKKKGRRTRRRNGNGEDDGSDFESEMDFQMELTHKIDQVLFDLLLGIEANAQERHNKDDREASLCLPLMSSSKRNETGEILLGAALALGDEDLVRGASLRVSHSPGLGLTKLSTESLKRIANAFRSLGDSHCNASFSLNDFSFDDIMPLVSMGALNKKAQRGEPMIINLRNTCDARKAPNLKILADSLGLYLLPEGVLDYEIKGSFPSLKVKYTMALRWTGGQTEYFPAKGGLYLSNFIGNFTVPASVDRDMFHTSRSVSWNLSGVSVSQSVRVSTPKRDGACDLLSRMIASRTANIAAERLTTLAAKSDDRGVSFEHIAAECGYDGDLLRQLVEGDTAMLSNNETKIGKLIAAKLEALLLSHDEPDDSEGVPMPDVQEEISIFLDQYLQLLNLVYCDVPRLRGLPPSACVAEKRVGFEATEDIFDCPPRLVRGVRRKLEKEERDRSVYYCQSLRSETYANLTNFVVFSHPRLVRSRELVAPNKYFTLVFLGSLGLFCCWSWLMCMQPFVPRSVSQHRIFFVTPYVCWALLGLWLMHAVLSMLKGPLLAKGDCSTVDGLWNVASSCVESLARKFSISVGRSTPFERTVQHLTTTCKQQHRQWTLRLARQAYFRALRRKKIAYSTCERLLKDLAEIESTQEGKLPGSLHEAEAFLGLDTEESEQANEQYMLEDLASEVQNLLQFTVGDRVIVGATETELTDSGRIASSALSTFSERTGSVISSFPGFVVVHFDGQRAPSVPVPVSDCTLLKDEVNYEEKAQTTGFLELKYPAVPQKDELVEDESRDEQTSEAKSAENGSEFRRHKSRTVEEALKAGGWQLVRKKNHIRYRRLMEPSVGEQQEQHFTMAKTPSDRRSHLNALATLNRLNHEGVPSRQTPVATGTDLIHCTICCVGKGESEFSKNQIKKQTYKCKDCVSTKEQ